ncbi:TPA: PD-(D/E)XK nuclease-like domain-containing protein [Klebsiella pneumoniae]|nr:PD-(D/E)XK nuclease-like domain-containing protein [Klebsiella pneumoniae]
MEYFYLIKATQKSGKADAVIWRTNKSEARALLQLDVDLEDAGIETGRGKDYQKPIRTDFPVFNDLPAEGVLDYSWCERYQLGDDGRTWALKPGQVPADHHIDDAGVTSETVETFGSDEYQDDSSALFNVAELPFRAQLLAQYMAEERHVYHISMPHRQELSALEMDTDNAAVQDLILAAERGAYVEGISDPTDPKWITEDLTKPKQPEVSNMGNGVFSIDGLMDSQPAPALSIVDQARQRAAEEKFHPVNSGGTTSDVQMETAQPVEDENDNAVSAGEGADEPPAQTIAVNMSKILAERCPDLTAEVLKSQVSESAHSDEEEDAEQAAPAWPEYFEPGRYEGVPNEVYHAANGISSTMVKDARVSLMYFEARHVSKTIQKVRSPVLDMGNLVHALALQPDQLEKEVSIEPEIPEGAFTTTATIRAFIDEYNNGLPVLLSADDIKRFLEEYNANLPAQVPLGTSVEETGQGYMSLPAEFQRIEDGQKQTATAMKACIKEYNATLPAQVKTSDGRDALLEQLALINPDMVAQEAQKAQPLKVSGTKADLIQAVKSVKPDAVFADELLDAWRENPEGKVLVTRQQLATALAIQKALLNHPTAGKLLTHPSRAVEVSYFGIDEETGLEVRVRPDLEIDMGGLRIGADLKTISMWNIKQEGLRAKLHREIIERDYHLSAAMYCETAALDQFFWIFVNKDENYHWIAIIEASEELLELGMLEYRKAMRAIANGFDTGEWPAPITEDYTEELNDFDMRRLEALRVQA